MITAKQLKDTYPHRQMRMYIEKAHPDLTVQQKAAKLGALVKKFLFNFEFADGVMQREKNLDEVPGSVTEAFQWDTTEEGQEFWSAVHNNEPLIIVKAPKAAKVAPKKRVGWWQ